MKSSPASRAWSAGYPCESCQVAMEEPKTSPLRAAWNHRGLLPVPVSAGRPAAAAAWVPGRAAPPRARPAAAAAVPPGVNVGQRWAGAQDLLGVGRPSPSSWVTTVVQIDCHDRRPALRWGEGRRRSGDRDREAARRTQGAAAYPSSSVTVNVRRPYRSGSSNDRPFSRSNSQPCQGHLITRSSRVDELGRRRRHEGPAQRPGTHRRAHVGAAVTDGEEPIAHAHDPDGPSVHLHDAAAVAADLVDRADPQPHAMILLRAARRPRLPRRRSIWYALTLTVPGLARNGFSTGATHDRADRPDRPEDVGESRFRLVDCDVHPIMKGGLADLRPYLSRSSQRRLGLDERRSLTTVGHREAVYPRNLLYVNQAGVLRDDARAPDGSAPGSDPAFTAHQLLDANGIDRAVLIGGEVLGLGAMPDPVAATIASAYNDWMCERWLRRQEVPGRTRHRTPGPRTRRQGDRPDGRGPASSRSSCRSRHPDGGKALLPDLRGSTAHGLPICVHPSGRERLRPRSPDGRHPDLLHRVARTAGSDSQANTGACSATASSNVSPS